MSERTVAGRTFTPLPEFPGYPVGVIPIMDAQDGKPLMKLLKNRMKKPHKAPRKGLRSPKKKTKFY